MRTGAIAKILRSFRLDRPRTVRSAVKVIAWALREIADVESCTLELPAERVIYAVVPPDPVSRTIVTQLIKPQGTGRFRWIFIEDPNVEAMYGSVAEYAAHAVPLIGSNGRFGTVTLLGRGRFEELIGGQSEVLTEVLSMLFAPYTTGGSRKVSRDENLKIELLESVGDELLMRRILKRMMELSHAEFCAYYTEGDESYLAVMLEARELSARIEEIRSKLATAYRMFSNRSAAIGVRHEKIYYRHREQTVEYLLATNRIESYFLVPVTFDTKVRGVLFFGSVRKDAFVRENIGLFRRMADEGSERTPLLYNIGGETAVLERILGAIPFGGALVSGEGRIIAANDGLMETIGIGGPVPETIQELGAVSPFNIVGVWEEFRVLKQNLVDRELRSSVNSPRCLSMTWIGLNDVSVDIGSLVLVRDITRDKELDRSREEMLAVVAHELRTPMTALKHSLEIMLERAAGGAGSVATDGRILETALRTTRRLGMLVDGLVNVSSLRMPDHPVTPVRTDMRRFIEDAALLFVEPMRKKGIVLGLDVEDDARIAIIDRDRVEQVIQNLLANSMKHVAAGGWISISVSVDREGIEHALPPAPWEYLPELRFIDIAVRDSGTGIPAEIAERISVPGSGTPGSGRPTKGLGLYIANRLVQAHGGALVIESGAGVHLYLPVDPVTGFIVQAARLIERRIDDLMGRGLKPTLYTMVKDGSRCWLEIAGAWKTLPVVNPKHDEISLTGLYLWPFGERVAAALTAEERFAGSPMSFTRNGRGGVRPLSGGAGDRVRIGWATGPREGKSYAELLQVSMDRISWEPIGVPVKGERHEGIPDSRRRGR